MSIVLKIIIVIFLSGIKFMFAIPLSALRYDFTFSQTVLFSVIGGVLGVLLFSFLSEKITAWLNKKQKKKKRSMKKAMAIKTARKYGLFGIAFLTPIFLSIPIGTFLALRFFPEKRKTIPILITSVVGWSLILSIAVSVF